MSDRREGGVVKKEKHADSTGTSHGGHANTGTGTSTGTVSSGIHNSKARDPENIGNRINYGKRYLEAKARDTESGPFCFDNAKACLEEVGKDAIEFYETWKKKGEEVKSENTLCELHAKEKYCKVKKIGEVGCGQLEEYKKDIDELIELTKNISGYAKTS